MFGVVQVSFIFLGIMKMFRSKNTVQQYKQKKLRLEAGSSPFPTQAQSHHPLSSQTHDKSHNPLSKQFQSHHPLSSQTHNKSHKSLSKQFQSFYPSSSQTHDNSHNPLPKPFQSVNSSSSQTHDNSHNPLSKQFQSVCPSFLLYRQNSSSSSSSYAHSESVPSQPAAFKPSFPQSSSSSLSDHDQDQDPINDFEKKLKELVEIIDEHGNILRLERMTTKKVQLLKNGEKVLVPVNHLRQPIKAAGGLCTRFMTLLLKAPIFCPPHTKNWLECKKHHGIRLMGELRWRFSLPLTNTNSKAGCGKMYGTWTTYSLWRWS